MTDTVKTVPNNAPTPMSRTSVKMGGLRRELKRLGFKQVILNQSKGKEYNNAIRGKVTKDYVEFFSIPDTRKNSHEDNVSFTRSFGMNYSYIGLEKDEQTVELNYQEKTATFNPDDKTISNKVNMLYGTGSISIPEFLKFLDEALSTTFNNEEDFFAFAIKALNMKEKELKK